MHDSKGGMRLTECALPSSPCLEQNLAICGKLERLLLHNTLVRMRSQGQACAHIKAMQISSVCTHQACAKMLNIKNVACHNSALRGTHLLPTCSVERVCLADVQGL